MDHWLKGASLFGSSPSEMNCIDSAYLGVLASLPTPSTVQGPELSLTWHAKSLCEKRITHQSLLLLTDCKRCRFKSSNHIEPSLRWTPCISLHYWRPGGSLLASSLPTSNNLNLTPPECPWIPTVQSRYWKAPWRFENSLEFFQSDGMAVAQLSIPDEPSSSAEPRLQPGIDRLASH